MNTATQSLNGINFSGWRRLIIIAAVIIFFLSILANSASAANLTGTAVTFHTFDTANYSGNLSIDWVTANKSLSCDVGTTTNASALHNQSAFQSGSTHCLHATSTYAEVKAIAFWIKPNAAVSKSTTGMYPFVRNDSDATYRYTGFGAFASAFTNEVIGIWDSRTTDAGWNWDENKLISCIGTGTLSAAWHHIVFNDVGGNVTRGAKLNLWIDGNNCGEPGEVVRSGTTDSAGGPRNLSGYSFAVHGKKSFSAYSSTGTMIDDFGMWSETLNSSDIATLYNSGAGYNPFNVPVTTPTPVLTIGMSAASPADNYHTNNASIQVQFGLNGTDLYSATANCSLLVNGTVNQTATNIAMNISTYNFTLATYEGMVNWAVNCSADGATNVVTATRNVVGDFTNPIMNYLAGGDLESTNGTTWNVLTSGRGVAMNTTIADTYLFAYDRTLSYCSNGTNITQQSATGITNATTSINLISLYNLTGDILGDRVETCLNITTRIADDHTARAITNYQITNKKSSITFKTETGNNIKIETREPSTIYPVKLTDRYEFTMLFDNATTKARTFDVKSECPLYYRPFSSYQAHFVAACDNGGGNWVDFDGAGHSPVVTRIDDYHYAVVLLDVPAVAEFRSIGGLNIVNFSTWFNASQMPAIGVTDLGASGTTINATTLTYSVPAGTNRIKNDSGVNTTTSATAVLQNILSTSEGMNYLNNITVQIQGDGSHWSRVTPQVNYRNGTKFNLSEQEKATAGYQVFTWTPTDKHNVTDVFFYHRTSLGGSSAYMRNASIDYNITYGTTVYNETGSVLLNMSGNASNSTAISVPVTGLTNSTTYGFYVTTWYYTNGSAIYNTTNATGTSINVTTAGVNGTYILTIYDEDTNLQITNETFFVELTREDNWSERQNSSTGTFTFSIPYNGIYEFRYFTASTGSYSYARSYFVTVNATGLTTTRLYAVQDTVSQYLVPRIIDENGLYVDNATIYMLRGQIESNLLTSYVVEMSRTDPDGNGLLRVVPNNVYYKFMVNHPTAGSRTTSFNKITGSTLTIQINTGTTPGENFNTLNNATATLSNTSNTIIYNWNDATSSVTQGCLVVKKTSQAGITSIVENACVASPSGSVSYIMTDTNQTSYDATASLWIGNATVTNSKTFSYKTGFRNFGLQGLFIAFLALIFIVFIAGSSAEGAILLSISGMVILGILGVIAHSWTAFVGIIVVGILILYKANKS